MPFAPPDVVPPAQVSRVLVTKLRHHGDVLLASPVVTALARALPHARIDALVYAETASMLAGHPALAQLFTIDRRRTRLARLAADLALLAALRRRRYDLLVHLTEHPRGLVLALALRPAFAVAREPARWRRAWSLGFTHFYPWPKGTHRHTVETNLDALRRIGIVPEEHDKRLVLVPARDDQAYVDAELARHGVSPRSFVQMHPGSRWLFKAWESERMAAVAHEVVRRGFAVIVTGAPEDRERAIVAAMLAALPAASRDAVHDFAGRLTLAQLAALTARARLFVGVDSAPMHIAAAVGTPAVALFGPSDEREWGPWRVAHRIVASPDHPCRPCRNDGCGGGKRSECLATLPVARVVAAIDDLLRETGASRAA